MLAAKKKIYTEPYKQPTKKKLVKQIMPKSVPNYVPKFRLLPIAVTIFMIFFAFVIISRYAEISRNHGIIVELENTLVHKLETQELLRLELTARQDLSRIEKIAATEIGMKYPDFDQVQYVVLPETPGDATVAQVDEYLIAENSNSIWGRILNMLIP